jgi:tRNA 2-thiouridine synthesizing protein A
MRDGETLDLRGLKCPLPALMARRALGAMAPGTAVIVLADDPLAVVDIPHMCHGEGHTVEAVTAAADHHSFALRVRPPVVRTAAATDA